MRRRDEPDRQRKERIAAERAALLGPIKSIEEMPKRKSKRSLRPDLGYIGEDGKLNDDGLHDEMLNSEAGEQASRKAALDAAIKRGVSRALAERLYGRD